MRKIFLFLTAMVFAVLMVGNVMGAGPVSDTSDGEPISLNTQAMVTVNGFLSLTLDNNEINFPNAYPGGDSVSTATPLGIMIGPETNVLVHVTTHSTVPNFVTTADIVDNTFPVSQMLWSSEYNTALSGDPVWSTPTLPEAYAIDGTPVGQVCDTTHRGLFNCRMTHELSIPDGKVAGLYTANIQITASQT